MHFSAWVAFLGAKPAWHIAAHHAAFAAMHLQGAIDFAELRKRSWSSGANGGGMERMPCAYFEGRIER